MPAQMQAEAMDASDDGDSPTVSCKAGAPVTGGYGAWWREHAGTRRRYLGDDGSFIDACDERGNLIEHVCATTQVCPDDPSAVNQICD